MLKRLLIKFLAPSLKETWAEILSDADNRDVFLGIARKPLPSETQLGQDATRILTYARTEDYAVFAREVWAIVINHLDKLNDDELTERGVDFHRGSLSTAMEILRISNNARNFREAERENAKIKENGHVSL